MKGLYLYDGRRPAWMEDEEEKRGNRRKRIALIASAIILVIMGVSFLLGLYLVSG